MTRRLPTEILQKIFEFALESDLTARETISSVCNEFEQILENIPKLEVYLRPDVEEAVAGNNEDVTVSMVKLCNEAGRWGGLMQPLISKLPKDRWHQYWLTLSPLPPVGLGWYCVSRVFCKE